VGKKPGSRLEKKIWIRDPQHLISSAFELILFLFSVFREMTSRLLSDLFQKVVSQRDIGKSFDYLIRQLGDLVLDTPEAALILG
jgi:hypothetical protein